MTKKQILNLLILLIVLAALIGGYFGMKSFHDADEAASAASEEDTDSVNIGTLSGNGICTLSWKHDGEDITVQKKDGIWYNGSVSLNSVTMNTKTSDLEIMSASRTITGDDVDLESFGLSEPSNVITAVDTEGRTQKIAIGVKNDVTGNYYCYLDDDPSTVYVLSSSVPSDFDTDADSLAAETDTAEE